MTDNQRQEFIAVLRQKSDEELRELVKAQGLGVDANWLSSVDRETLITMASSDDSIPETERIDLDG